MASLDPLMVITQSVEQVSICSQVTQPPLEFLQQNSTSSYGTSQHDPPVLMPMMETPSLCSDSAYPLGMATHHKCTNGNGITTGNRPCLKIISKESKQKHKEHNQKSWQQQQMTNHLNGK
jgi:hypothetical protein